MTDYRLDGLSPRTFEHLVQALSYRAISPTVTPFGDGADGGREATFNGLTNYGPDGGRWDGYGVIQAKFHQRIGSPKADGEWFLKELTKELKKYDKNGSKRKLPEYYVAATNVVLTPAEESGSKDKAFKVLEGFAVHHDLKGVDIWDYDKLRILLDNNDAVSRKYAAWITAGDVLLQIGDWLSGKRNDLHRLVTNFLQKELLSDQFAKLEQAGHTAEEAIPLAQVFVDLPATSRGYASYEFSESTYHREGAPFAKYIIEKSSGSLVHDFSDDDVAVPHGPLPGRFVLIGGPGQGKTTLGQYVCQIFRVALLRDVPKGMLDVEARRVIDGFESGAEEGSTTPGARRLPFRVVLSDFATALADNSVASLLEYLAAKFSKRTNSTLTVEQFQLLIVEYPSLLVLDGLDEVPASSNRDQVLSAVQDFSVDVSSYRIDMLILATSRPQGYNEDFSPKTYEHRWLIPLSSERALEYGTKLAKVRFAGDSDRVDKVVGRLTRAATAQATARIMKSPLQVTILTLLVDRRGQLPQERWALFDEYYGLIYQRETERDIPTAEVLRNRKDDIDAVHRLVGLLLQVESEKSGGTEARLTTEQFSQLVEEYLASEGNEGQVLVNLRDSIIEGAANRLVFLVGLESGQVGFEIRSLQEFMAAEGILDAEDGLVQSRLRSIAGNSNWRNVMLFAAGKIFAKRRYLRDTIESICTELNELDEYPIGAASRLVFAGSELALDLLEDGPVARQPAKNRSLTRLSLKLLELEGASWARRLAGVFQETTKDIYEDAIKYGLGGTRGASRNASICLTALLDLGVESLVYLASADIAQESDTLAEIIMTCGDSPPESIISILVRQVSAKRPLDVQKSMYKVREYVLSERTPQFVRVPWLRFALRSIVSDPVRRERRFLTARINNTARSNRAIGELAFNAVGNRLKDVNDFVHGLPDGADPAWQVIVRAAVFEQNPSKGALSDVIRAAAITDERNEDWYVVPSFSSWPVEECLRIGYALHNWEQLAQAIDSGNLGDRPNWEQWQDQWLGNGIGVADIRNNILGALNSSGLTPWIPLLGGRLRFRWPALTDPIFTEAVAASGAGCIRDTLLDAAISGYSYRSKLGSLRAGSLQPPVLNAIMEMVRSGSWPVVVNLMDGANWAPPLEREWVDAFIQGGKDALAAGISFMRSRSMGSWVESALRMFPDCVGLIAAVAASGPALFESDLLTRILQVDFEGDPVLQMARAVLIIRKGGFIENAITDIIASLASNEIDVRPIIYAIDREDTDADRRIGELLRLRELAVGSGGREVNVIVSVIHNALRRRQSELLDGERWRQLGFPDFLRKVVKETNSSGT